MTPTTFDKMTRRTLSFQVTTRESPSLRVKTAVSWLNLLVGQRNEGDDFPTDRNLVQQQGVGMFALVSEGRLKARVAAVGSTSMEISFCSSGSTGTLSNLAPSVRPVQKRDNLPALIGFGQKRKVPPFLTVFKTSLKSGQRRRRLNVD